MDRQNTDRKSTASIYIPPVFAVLLLRAACETGSSVEDIAETALRNYLYRRRKRNAGR